MSLTFSKLVYRKSKAQHLNAYPIIIAGYAFPWTLAEIERLFIDNGFTELSHYNAFGITEGLNPYVELDGLLILTDASKQIVETINDNFNNSITYISDILHYNVAEFWNLPADGKGDCEDYAMVKDKELARHGIQGLFMTCTVPGMGYHAVLIVRTDRGDLVLDNLYTELKYCKNSNLVWDKMEWPDGKWYNVTVLDNRFVKGQETTPPPGYSQMLARHGYNKNTW